MYNPSYPQYISYRPKMTVPEDVNALRHFCTDNNLCGTEVFFDDFVPRNSPLFLNENDKQKLIQRFMAHSVKRLHCSYWAWPTAFLAREGYDELLNRFGTEDAVIAYYGDLTGEHIFSRWADEYELAAELKAETYVFHLIDYAPIDGLWIFTLSRNEILCAMSSVLRTFIDKLEARGLLASDSPTIEIENAGWGLEYGVQTAEDFDELFKKINNPHGKVRIGWDINHLLHAVGFDEVSGAARFFLPEDEISEAMRALQNSRGNSPSEFAQAWIEHNFLHPSTINKVGTVHLSDCVMKKTEYFCRGQLSEPYCSEIGAISDLEGKEVYGLELVLRHYDSHVPLGSGVLRGGFIRQLLEKLAAENEDFSLLHELKNAQELPPVFGMQLNELENN